MSTKISEMTAATDLTNAVIPIVQGGVNKKADADLFGGGSEVTASNGLTKTDGDIKLGGQLTEATTLIQSEDIEGASFSIYLTDSGATDRGTYTSFSASQITLTANKLSDFSNTVDFYIKAGLDGGILADIKEGSFTVRTSLDNEALLDRIIIDKNGNISMPNLPTDPTGLTAGMLYNDNGTVKIVLP